jgi:hypothetical protein
LENLKGRYHSGDLGVDGRIILEWILVSSDNISVKFLVPNELIVCVSCVPESI